MRESLLILFPKIVIKRLHLVFLRQDYIMVIDHKGFFFLCYRQYKKKKTQKNPKEYIQIKIEIHACGKILWQYYGKFISKKKTLSQEESKHVIKIQMENIMMLLIC